MQQNNSISATAPGWARLLAIPSIALGIAVVCGWIWDISEFKSIWASMRMSTATSLLLSGAVLFFQTLPINGALIVIMRRLAIMLVMLNGMLTLSGYFFAWDVGVEQLLTQHTPGGANSPPFPVRAPLLSAICLVLLSCALFLSEVKRYSGIVQYIAAIVAITVLAVLTGYLFSDFDPLVGLKPPPIQIGAALGIVCLSIGIIINTPTSGFFIWLRKRLPMLNIISALLLIGLSGGTALQILKQSREAANWVEHTYEVMLHLESAVSSLNVYSAGNIAFLHDLNEAHLKAAAAAREKVQIERLTIQQLTADNPQQQQRFPELQSMLEQRFALVDELIRSQREQGLNPVPLPESDQAERLNAKIVQQLYQMKATELALLKKRQQLADAKNSLSNLVLAVSLLLSLLMLLVAFRALRREVEQHRQSLLRLQENEARLRAFFNTRAIGIVVINEKGCIVEFNVGSEEIFGFTRAEVMGQNVNILMPEPYHSEHDGYLKRYLDGGQPKIIGFDREVYAKSKNNVDFPVELSIGEASDGDKRAFVGFIKDITLRKHLESSKHQFESIVQSSDDAIMSKTLQGIVTSWNPGAERMFGYSAEEMMGYPLLKLFPADRLDEEKFLLDQIAHGHRVNHFETVRVRKDAVCIDVSVTLSPICDDAGNIIGVSKIVRDITRSKQTELELKEAKRVAETANQTKSEFLANMSHEIRTPMNAIIGLTRLVQETELTPRQYDYLHKIQTSSQALLGILNDILDLSKIESGRMDIECIEFDPTQMLQGVSNLFAAKAEEKGLELFLDVSPEIPLTVKGDPLRIQQVLSNLVSNAIKFTPKGEIDIRIALAESRGDDLLLRLSVRDTGIGISDAVIEHLFQPFTQADASITRKFGGSGLGLVISKQLVELLGGSISVVSLPGQGSTFSFTVLCGKGQPYNWIQDSHHLQNTRVLVVDDQETSCIILKNILESWRLLVETALSAEEGIQKIEAAVRAGAPFNLLLLDWKMEGISGLELAYQLQCKESQGEIAHSPTVIMVTAYSKDRLLREASESSVHLDAILTKPVLPSNLLNTILHVYHYQGKDNRIPETHIDPYEAARPLHEAAILLVEDNELNQQVAGEFLEKAGLRVSIACHGGEALRWIERKKFDAVLMDLQMPEMDGYEATRRIRELPYCRNLPIIAMTAAAMTHDREACLAVGMNDHIAKPINPNELIDVLLRWVKLDNTQGVIRNNSGESVYLKTDLAEKLQGFDLKNIMMMLRGNEEQLLRMLAGFREQFVREVPAFTSQVAAGDLATAEKWLHTLKGAAGNLGAKVLHQACADLDEQLRKGSYDAATLADWKATFEKTMQTIIDLQEPLSTQALPLAALDVDILQHKITELDALLSTDSFVSDELLGKLKTLLPDDKQAECDNLIQYILVTDYPQARATLKTLMSGLNGTDD